MLKMIVEIRIDQSCSFIDSKYAATIKAEWCGVHEDGSVLPSGLSEEEVKSIVQMFVKKFEENSGECRQAKLRKLSPKNPKIVCGTVRASEWEVLVVEPAVH